ncbi:hypothetical protein OYT88_15180 [Sporolactobacillus sp. CQH2019]|uniref:hypothetical protein n=1 Tax=Sporolactobacillus sp. CQH2019 TaxID=3023512 RepID=UPI0023685479|nr:hypothetical protein [Sporolactobacillus sp. CQH2019]MDD9149895.1 hypothetical protein [Sporolactobacillus sp. CQH2019]
MPEIKKSGRKKAGESGFDALLRQVRKKYSYDPQRQIEFFRSEQSSARFELIGLLKVLEMHLGEEHKTFEISSESMDCIFRSLIDLAVHLKEGLPDGVYEYTLGNLKEITDSILKQGTDADAVRRFSKKCLPASALPGSNLFL